MIATRLPGYTGVAGADQQYTPLPFKSEQVQVDYGKFGIVEVQQLTFAFLPSPEELSQLLAGQAVYLEMWHDAIPPMKVFVGDPGEVPEEHKHGSRRPDRLHMFRDGICDRCGMASGTSTEKQKKAPLAPYQCQGYLWSNDKTQIVNADPTRDWSANHKPFGSGE